MLFRYTGTGGRNGFAPVSAWKRCRKGFHKINEGTSFGMQPKRRSLFYRLEGYGPAVPAAGVPYRYNRLDLWWPQEPWCGGSSETDSDGTSDDRNRCPLSDTKKYKGLSSRNVPWNIAYVAQKIAEIKETDTEEVRRITLQNTKNSSAFKTVDMRKPGKQSLPHGIIMETWGITCIP